MRRLQQGLPPLYRCTACWCVAGADDSPRTTPRGRAPRTATVLASGGWDELSRSIGVLSYERAVSPLPRLAALNNPSPPSRMHLVPHPGGW